MGYTYTPAYYSTLQDSITSICKSILPFSLNKRRLTAAEQKLSKQQSDNLKWQQTSFHQMLNLMGLHKEGLVPDAEVSAFRSQLLDTLIASKGSQNEQPSILRDKLLFLQELLHTKCISAEEYHASKRPLLQRLAVQGAELEASDVIVGTAKENSDEGEEWSVIDLKDEQSLLKKDNLSSKHKFKNGSAAAVKHIKDAASVFQKLGKNKDQRSIFDLAANDHTYQFDDAGMSGVQNKQTAENPFWDNQTYETESETKSILMSESLAIKSDKFDKECQRTDEGKKKSFRSLFRKEGKEGIREVDKLEEKTQKSARKQWGFDGLKKWKKNHVEDETTPLPLGERSSGYMEPSEPIVKAAGESPDSKHIKRKLTYDSPSSGFIIDKVLGEKIRKELLQTQSELSSKDPNFRISDEQMDVISTKLPVDKSGLRQLFPKSWCDRYGDVVVDVVKKEYKDHVGENEEKRNATLERRHTSSKRWTTFEDVENCHPNLFAAQTNKKSVYDSYQNPFWNASSIQSQ